jgi:uncharacterized protein YpuA (DUF1002 family)
VFIINQREWKLTELKNDEPMEYDGDILEYMDAVNAFLYSTAEVQYFDKKSGEWVTTDTLNPVSNNAEYEWRAAPE